MRSRARALLFLVLAALAVPALAYIPVAPPSIVGEVPAAGRLLIASRAIGDPHFRHAVILLLQHDERGTVGVIVNHPSRIRLAEVFPDLHREAAGAGEAGPDDAAAIYFGGPVQPVVLSMLVRTAAARTDKHYLLERLYLVFGSREVTEAITQVEPADALRVYSGYAGWVPGQLEAEIQHGGWHVLPGDPELVFSSAPESVWEHLIRQVSGVWT